MKETLICDKASSSYPSSICYFPNRNGQGWVPLKQEGKFLWHRSALNVKQTMTIAVTSKLSLCGSHSSHVVTMGWVHKETVINFIEPKSGEESKPELEGNWSLVQLPFPHSTHTSQLCCVGCDGKTSLSFWEKCLLSERGLWDLQRGLPISLFSCILATCKSNTSNFSVFLWGDHLVRPRQTTRYQVPMPRRHLLHCQKNTLCLQSPEDEP